MPHKITTEEAAFLADLQTVLGKHTFLLSPMSLLQCSSVFVGMILIAQDPTKGDDATYMDVILQNIQAGNHHAYEELRKTFLEIDRG